MSIEKHVYFDKENSDILRHIYKRTLYCLTRDDSPWKSPSSLSRKLNGISFNWHTPLNGLKGYTADVNDHQKAISLNPHNNEEQNIAGMAMGIGHFLSSYQPGNTEHAYAIFCSLACSVRAMAKDADDDDYIHRKIAGPDASEEEIGRLIKYSLSDVTSGGDNELYYISQSCRLTHGEVHREVKKFQKNSHEIIGSVSKKSEDIAYHSDQLSKTFVQSKFPSLN